MRWLRASLGERTNDAARASHGAWRVLLLGAALVLSVASCGGGDSCDRSAAVGPVLEYLVQIGVISQSGLLGALQFDVDFTGCSGGWQGAGGSVNCSFEVPVGLAQCNDLGGGGLRCALVDVDGFDTPIAVVTCVFKTSENLLATDFAFSPLDAADVNANKVDVVMAVTDLVQR